MAQSKRETFRTPGKRRRRDKGSGALFKRGNVWVAVIDAKKVLGPDWRPGIGDKRGRIEVTSVDKARCETKRDERVDDLHNGVVRTPRRKITVEQRIREWAQIERHAKWSPNHHVNVLAAINQQIAPSIGEVGIKTLGTEDVRYMLRWMNEQTKTVRNPDGTAKQAPRWKPRTKQIAYDRLREWLDDELKERPKLIRENYATLLEDERPGGQSDERTSHTNKQATKVLETALGWGDPLVTLWVARYVTGLRQGELLGMQEDRINWENLTWDISWQLQGLPLKPNMKNSDDADRFSVPDTFKHIPLYKNLALIAPKTKRPRLQPIPVEFAIMLRTYLDNRLPNPFGLIWVTEQFRPIRRKYETEAWQDAQARASVPIIEGHGTRHTANTLIPVDETHRMKFLGQSTAAANRIYLHEDLEKLREGQNALAGMLLPEKIVPASQRLS